MTQRTTTSPPCPDGAIWLRVLALDTFSEEESWLLEHLEHCSRCRAALELAAGNEMVDCRCLASPPEAAGEALEGAIHRLVEGPVMPEPTGEVGSIPGLSTTILESPGDAGHLGRLGPFDVTEVLGQGGMGIVLKAFDSTLRRFVAVKVLRPHLASNPAARQRFKREARAAAAVRHENVVAIHGVDEANGLPYLVMELVPGASLQEWLDRFGPLDIDEVLRIGREAAEGLAAAHEGGLIHRDVKPGNILLEKGTRRVKVTDFGLARTADEAALTQSSVLAGTPPYMSPEQAWGAPLDYRADLFSLASVLYVMCTGRPPFGGDSPLGILRSIAQDQPVPLRDLNPAVPAWLADMISLLHAKAPARRIGSAAEVASLLARYIAHRENPTQVPRPRLPGRPRRSRPRRWQLGLIAGLGLAVVGVLALAGGARLRHAWSPSPEIPPLPQRWALPMARTEFESSDFGGPVLGAAFSPGGELLATGGDDGVVRVWQFSRGEPLHEIHGHTSRVWSVAFSPDGKTLASAGGDWHDRRRGVTVNLWDVLTGEPLRRFEGHDQSVFCVAFSPDGKTLATASSDHTLRLWDPTTGRPRAVLRGHRQEVRFVAFSPDGKTLASAGFDGKVLVWDAVTGKTIMRLEAEGRTINCVAFSPDGRTLAAAENAPLDQPSATGGRVVLWDMATQKVRAQLAPHAGNVWCVAYSPDGSVLVSGGAWQSRGELKFWDAATGAEGLNVHAQVAWVEGLAFSPDGGRLAAVGGFAGKGDLIVWNVNLAAFR